MSCAKILDTVYEYYGRELRGETSMPLLLRIQVGLHLLVCPDCAQEVERFEVCRDILRYDFLPPSPPLEDSIMAMIAEEENSETENPVTIPGGLSTRGWVIAGIIMLVSLATAFIGLDFNKVALAAGMSFLVPVGITIGIALTGYGALFIGSHLKELRERFGL
ncbi:MAG: peptidoglycan-binding protein [Treponema sp.]|jgi:hypothetical protein|nr:peptidoglycan-binding protein [Treponema sp.]